MFERRPLRITRRGDFKLGGPPPKRRKGCGRGAKSDVAVCAHVGRGTLSVCGQGGGAAGIRGRARARGRTLLCARRCTKGRYAARVAESSSEKLDGAPSSGWLRGGVGMTVGVTGHGVSPDVVPRGVWLAEATCGRWPDSTVCDGEVVRSYRYPAGSRTCCAPRPWAPPTTVMPACGDVLFIVAPCEAACCRVRVRPARGCDQLPWSRGGPSLATAVLG